MAALTVHVNKPGICSKQWKEADSGLECYHQEELAGHLMCF